MLPTDALAPVIDLLADLPAQVRAGLSDQQVETVAHRLMAGCQGWARHFLWAAWLRSGALLAVTLLVVLGVGISVGWVAHAPAQGMVCADLSDGSRLCWLYQKLPNRR